MEIVEFHAKVGNTENVKNMYATVTMYFVFCRLYPFSHQPPRQCLGPYLSSLTSHCIAGANLSNNLVGRHFAGPKKKTIVGLFSIQSSLNVCK